jgi:hypothetical protein
MFPIEKTQPSASQKCKVKDNRQAMSSSALKSGTLTISAIDKSGAYVMPLQRFFHRLFS